MTHIIAEPCVGTKDTACVDVCPLYLKRKLPLGVATIWILPVFDKQVS